MAVSLLLSSVLATPFVTTLADPMVKVLLTVLPEVRALESPVDEALVLAPVPVVVAPTPPTTTDPNVMDVNVIRSTLVVFSPMPVKR